MAVTELALLRLKDPYTEPPPELLNILAEAKATMEAFNGSGSIFHILQQVEDPACLYVFGDWASRDAHVNGFVPSDANQKIVGHAASYLDVERLAHFALKGPDGASSKDVPLADGAVITIGQYLVAKGKRGEFERGWAEKRHLLQKFVKKGTKLVGGWRVHEEVAGEESEERVHFAGWDTMEDFVAFTESPEGQEYIAAAGELGTRIGTEHAKKLL